MCCKGSGELSANLITKRANWDLTGASKIWEMLVPRASWNYILFSSSDHSARVKKILEKCECFSWLNKWRYDLVFDDDEHNSKSENKRKKQNRGSHSDEEERKIKHSHDNDHKRNRRPDEKEKERRHKRKAHYSSSEDEPRERGKRDQKEKRRSPSSSEDDERINRKKSKADHYSRSHKVSNCLLSEMSILC